MDADRVLRLLQEAWDNYALSLPKGEFPWAAKRMYKEIVTVFAEEFPACRSWFLSRAGTYDG